MKELAARRGTSVAELIRQTVDRWLETSGAVPPEERYKRVLDIKGAGVFFLVRDHSEFLHYPMACPLKEECAGSPLGNESDEEKEVTCGAAAGLRPAAAPQVTLFPPRARSGMQTISRFGKGWSGRIRIDNYIE